MSISDLFDSGLQSRNKGHFSSIIRIAMEDGTLSEEEKVFLDKLAVHLEISPEEYAEIIENPAKYPFNPPYLHVRRLERLYDLSRMISANHIIGPKQKETLSKYALALGFTPQNVHYIVDKALSLMVLDADLDTFVYEMENMHK